VTTAYVSSTFVDLQDCRKEVQLALSRLGVTDVSMEYYVAESAPPLDVCLRDVAECDFYIGIFAWRYGVIPPGASESITELEYRMAVAKGKPTLIFVLREEAAWPRNLMDRDPTRIEALREEFGQTTLFSQFSTPQELATLVTVAVHKMLKAQGKPLPDGGYLDPEVIRTYYERIVQQYGRLDLETLTPSQFEDQLRIQLNSVFVEPDVRTELPVLDLPKDLQRWLATQGSLDEADVRGGLNTEERDRLRRAYQQRPRRKMFDLLGPGAGQRVVLLGDPGAGKSTLLRYVALSLADPAVSAVRTPFGGCLPVLIELKTYESARAEQRCATFLEFLDYLSRTEGLGLDKGVLDQYLSEDGRAVALFDGLDEIFEPAQRAAVTRQIAAFAMRYPNVSVLVTSRIIGYSRGVLADAGFTHATIQDLDAAQISDFLTGWYALALHDRPVVAARSEDRLLAAIADSTSISEMAGNPLLLTILAIIGRHQELPRERWRAYDYAATVLVDRWDVNRHLHDERLPIVFISEDDKKELLRRIAWLMQAGTRHGGNYLTRDEMQLEFEIYLRDRFGCSPTDAAIVAHAMINQFRERNFILSRYGGELYGFVHRAFLEFFCAERFRWQFEKDQAIDIDHLKSEVFGEHWDDSSWREVLRLIAGTIQERWAAEIIIFLTDGINASWPWKFGDHPPRNIALAVQCLAEKRPVASLDRAARRVLVRVIQLIEHCVLDDDRLSCALLANEIIPAMATIGQAWPGREIFLDWYLARGARMVWSPVSSLASRIAVCLYPNEPRLLRSFLESIRTVRDSRLCVPLLDRLDDYIPTDPGIRAELLDSIAHDQAERVREAAVRALAGLGADLDVRTLLLDRAAHDDDDDVREAAVRALAGLTADPAVRALVLERASRDQSWAVRQVAVRALTGAPDAEVRAFLLECAIRDADNRVREAAVEVLAGLPTDADIRAVLLGRAAYSGVREAAARARAGLPADTDVRSLLLDQAVQSESGAARQAAVRALADQTTDPDVRALLLDRAGHDHDHQVRQAAVRVIAGLSADPGVRALLLDRAVCDEDDEVREAAVRALADQTTDPDVRALLLDRAGHDHDDKVREAAVAALTNTSLDAEIRALLLDRAGHDHDDKVREAAVAALTNTSLDAEIRALLLDRARYDHDDKVRQAAVRALAALAADHDVRVFLLDRAADDADHDTRAAAVAALAGTLTNPEVRARLLDLAARDESWVVRLAAVRAMSRITAGADVRALLLDLAARDTDSDVREAAVSALAALAADPDVRALLLDRAADPEHNVREAAVKGLTALPADADIRAVLLGRAAHGNGREATVRSLTDASADAKVRALLLDRAAEAEFGAVREAAVRALAGLPTDAEVRTLLMDRAAHDEDNRVREAAVRALAAQPGDPAVRAFLLNRAAHDTDEEVWLPALDIILSADSGDAVAEFIVSTRADEPNNNRARQLAVRLLSCSAKFTPDMLPPIPDGSSWP
jgi:HEAT repeat protein